MAEPASSGAAAAGAFGWKFIGGLAGVAALGATLASIVVLCMSRPRSGAEWAVGLISTALGSIAGGAAVIVYFELLRKLLLLDGLELYVALTALIGLAFTCGLPAWFVVRWIFNWMERRRDKDAGEVLADARRELRGDVQRVETKA